MLRKSSHREYISRLGDDEAEEGPASRSDVENLFALTDEDEESISFTYDELFESEASEPDDLYSCNGYAAVANEETGAVDVSQVSTEQWKKLKSFNDPGFPQYPGSSWSLTVSKYRRIYIALPPFDNVLNFIVTFCHCGGISTEAYLLPLST